MNDNPPQSAAQTLRMHWLIGLAGLFAVAAGTMLVLVPLQLFRGERKTPNSGQRSAIADSPIVGWHHVEGFAQPLAQFQTVFWDPRDTESLRRLIRETELVRGKTVLEVGTGTGLLALCCIQSGASKVVATDVNSAAILNARYNAESLGAGDRLETRLVSLAHSEAFSVIRPEERFDVIISNPPWENVRPAAISEYALYDEGFTLLRSLLRDLPQHLSPGGRMFLAYGSRDAIREVERLGKEYKLEVRILDDRSLDALPEVFLPGMLLEIRAVKSL